MSIFAAPNFYNQADQNIYSQGYSFIPQEMYRGGAFNFPTSATTTGGVTTLPAATTMNMGGGGDGGIPFSGTASDLTTDFMDTITDRQNRLNNPPDKFFGFDTMRDQQLTGADAGFYIGSGTDIPQEQTFAGKAQDFLTPQSADQIIAEGYEPKMKLGILANLVPDRYGELPRGDQAFIARNMGYTGPTVFGENTTGGSKDPFGLNVRSAFGNYAERVGVEAEKLGNALTKSAAKRGLTFDASQGALVDSAGNIIDEDEYDAAMKDFINQTKLMRTKFGYYTQQTKQRDADRAAAKAAEEAAAAAAAKRERDFAAKGMSDPNDPSRQGASGRRPGSGGTVDRVTEGPGRNVDDTGQAYDSGGREGFGYGLADGGRVQYMMGGLANLVDIYD